MHKIISSSLVLGLGVVTFVGAGCTASTDVSTTNTNATNVATTNTVKNANTTTNTTVVNTNVVTKDITATMGKDFTVNVGQAALVDDEVEVMVTKVTDSRCPEGTQCVTAGTVKVEVALGVEGEEDTFSIDASGSSEDPTSETVEGYTVTVGEVTPLPTSGVTFAQEDYTVTLNVEAGE